MARYETIIVNFDEKPGEILVKQLRMLKERHKSRVVAIVDDMYSIANARKWFNEHVPGLFEDVISREGRTTVNLVKDCCKTYGHDETAVLFIGSLKEGEEAPAFKVQNPKDMLESYNRAMGLLQGYTQLSRPIQ